MSDRAQLIVLEKYVRDIISDVEDFARRDRIVPEWSSRPKDWHTGRAVGYESVARWLRRALQRVEETSE